MRIRVVRGVRLSTLLLALAVQLSQGTSEALERSQPKQLIPNKVGVSIPIHIVDTSPLKVSLFNAYVANYYNIDPSGRVEVELTRTKR
ncbi:hypothetical protein HS1genome_1131 [Sulfodiicoccus acidiphilus]|uniref:Uncharacterized protein n=1 Tax=Sulfodiicoccus acidiphilus TaxID=1670455 RepID=A0A348B3J0_9CREN|nr:hypothetical protein [Sulfodiicoccus acidiphilus]BBD72742.1 hypothetical protein HS1genome_1131 [Sulfodiicoccus acidiphilus]GGT95140.1 hypothetical protein GCM10007116_10760 [Sulfodiicoccus acidiphilus]